jgi:cytochrome c
MRRVGRAITGCAFLLMTSLLLGRAHPFGDAALFAAKSSPEPIMAHTSIPPEVRATLAAKCADCHSMQTRPSIYGRFAPASWLMERDILEGRRQINLSLWETYSADQQQTFKAKIVQEVKTHKMPLPQYRMIHWSTHVTDADILALTQWTRAMPATAGSSSQPAVAEGDPVRGKEVFEKRCTGCHAMEQDREGPHLRGVYGRTSGAVAGFLYSHALIDAHIVWNESSLEQWLTDPDTLVPGNNMEFHVPKPQERRDLIRFLEQTGK